MSTSLIQVECSMAADEVSDVGITQVITLWNACFLFLVEGDIGDKNKDAKVVQRPVEMLVGNYKLCSREFAPIGKT
ncbi:hypothetical protein BFJ63_vAg7362 [Fusarium oxysporum f. sp. narcissi]|uniref:Uncharacterized protein n=1 Tax=Fusarium oxysporum f. sp. narcissi TaxID=451672 RepID=A0A4Q2VSS3_FUSOX|nr:hypothetical protein FOWG_14121 [Fusarium oxysporum f. sp. lycopersici MN25]RKL40335.1 hypothetical protein BFJ70_g5565 [Fusarium oxysporum]RYC89704.1 hypothetical protein BFJ63_vAg7362 [Fusarium oxysporum f. sp. narcissi]